MSLLGYPPSPSGNDVEMMYRDIARNGKDGGEECGVRVQIL